MDRILPTILATLTNRARHKVTAGVDFQWSSNCWTHNLFRLWELIFWRKCGKNGIGDTIRFEASTRAYYDYEKNETIQVHSFGTWESLIAHTEGMVRMFLKGMTPRLVKVPLPIPVFAGGYMGIDARGAYVFAIAFDANAVNKDNAGVITTLNVTHVTTGSNTYMVLNGGTLSSGNGNTVTHNSFTYNGVASTNEQTKSNAPSSQSKVSLWDLVAPTTGSNTAALVISAALTGGGQQLTGVTNTYTGCKQSGQPDSSNSNGTGSSVNPFPVTTTVVASNCWLSGSAIDQSTFNSGTAGSGTTYRGAIQFNHQAADSNGTVGTGSQSLNWGEAGGGSVAQGTILSLAPVAVAGATVVPMPFRSLLGVGI